MTFIFFYVSYVTYESKKGVHTNFIADSFGNRTYPVSIAPGIVIDNAIVLENKVTIKTSAHKEIDGMFVCTPSTFSNPHYILERKRLILKRPRNDIFINLGAGPVLPVMDDKTFSSGEVDFPAQYEIFHRRISCMQLDPDYAKKKIIAAIAKLKGSAMLGDFLTTLFTYNRLYTEAKLVDTITDPVTYRKINIDNRFFTLEGIERKNQNLDMKALLQQNIKLLAELLQNHYLRLQR